MAARRKSFRVLCRLIVTLGVQCRTSFFMTWKGMASKFTTRSLGAAEKSKSRCTYWHLSPVAVPNLRGFWQIANARTETMRIGRSAKLDFASGGMQCPAQLDRRSPGNRQQSAAVANTPGDKLAWGRGCGVPGSASDATLTRAWIRSGAPLLCRRS
jgi:hypothetical protein